MAKAIPSSILRPLARACFLAMESGPLNKDNLVQHVKSVVISSCIVPNEMDNEQIMLGVTAAELRQQGAFWHNAFIVHQLVSIFSGRLLHFGLMNAGIDPTKAVVLEELEAHQRRAEPTEAAAVTQIQLELNALYPDLTSDSKALDEILARVTEFTRASIMQMGATQH